MKDWQFDVVFVVGIIGALVMLFSDPLHISIRPEVVTLFGLMLAFLYQQKKNNDKEKKDKDIDWEHCTRRDLEAMSLVELKALARKVGYTVHDYKDLDRYELENLILAEGDRLGRGED